MNKLIVLGILLSFIGCENSKVSSQKGTRVTTPKVTQEQQSQKKADAEKSGSNIAISKSKGKNGATLLRGTQTDRLVDSGYIVLDHARKKIAIDTREIPQGEALLVIRTKDNKEKRISINNPSITSSVRFLVIESIDSTITEVEYINTEKPGKLTKSQINELEKFNEMVGDTIDLKVPGEVNINQDDIQDRQEDLSEEYEEEDAIPQTQVIKDRKSLKSAKKKGTTIELDSSIYTNRLEIRKDVLRKAGFLKVGESQKSFIVTYLSGEEEEFLLKDLEEIKPKKLKIKRYYVIDLSDSPGYLKSLSIKKVNN